MNSIKIDSTLLAGAAVFGVGWGLSGVCPGPAVFNLGFLDSKAVVFFAAMLAGFAVERIVPFLSPPARPAAIEQDG